MRRAFSLIEILIIVALVGIVAAIVVPTFQSYAIEAKEALAKDYLRILRNAIDLYAIAHNDIPPGYQDKDGMTIGTSEILVGQLTKVAVDQNVSSEPAIGQPSFPFFSNIPENPFNNKNKVKIISNNGTFPEEPVQTDIYGWIYKPATRIIKLNWEGTDKDNVDYFDY